MKNRTATRLLTAAASTRVCISRCLRLRHSGKGDTGSRVLLVEVVVMMEVMVVAMVVVMAVVASTAPA